MTPELEIRAVNTKTAASVVDTSSQPLIYAITKNKSYDWHCRLGNASDRVVRKFLQIYVPSFNQKQWTPFVSEHCLVSKSTRRALQAQDEIPQAHPRDLMVTDVIGPISQVDIHGNKYLLTLRDHASTLVFFFPLKSQDQVTSVITNALKLIHNVFHKSVKFIRADNPKEYKENKFNVQLVSMGTQHIFTSPYTPEQNGEAERLNWTLGDTARTMLKASGIPSTFWLYAYKVAAYIHNWIPNTKSRDKTLLELWCGRQPQAQQIHPFGAKAVAHVPIEKRGKLDNRGRICRLIGFQDDSRGFFSGMRGKSQ
ncbi:hypothetical protein O181_078255 [Austropuccinia psidii MF-1]|uniref:Integrase catalytic domain-containing protein n=1 Tax=Austropuccinia psidii MF-1 TaxID=1389203 RepID=A0A9Q3IGS7_9BASI|nr:hypothetical protein [Austropuccinia psidii MF-1]